MELNTTHRKALGLARIALGWVFFWAFIDKVFGLGFATVAGKAWINGVSPTYGFLKFGTTGSFASAFQGLAGNILVDWLFMIGLFGLGLALILGIGMRIAAYAGTILLLLLYVAVFPTKNNPIVDEHIIYILLLIALYAGNAGEYFGIGRWWSQTALVKRFIVLR